MFVAIVHLSCVNLNLIGMSAPSKTGPVSGTEPGIAGADTQGTYFPAAACHLINHIQELS
jgi:hypothetical protein